MDIAAVLRNFFIESIGLNEEISYQTRLFSDGHVDSMDLADLVAFVHEKFDIVMPPSGFTVENLDTIESQEKYIRSLQAAKSE